jgi:hypothetical protein
MKSTPADAKNKFVDIVGDKFSVETIQGSPFFSVAKKTGG